MSKNKIEELERDDEVLREQGMTSGHVKSARWELRPTAAIEVSWMQRNRTMEADGMDVLWKTCAFAYIHSEQRSTVRACVNDHDLFTEKVDEWIDKNKPTSDDIKDLAAVMNDRLLEWFSSSSELASSGPSSGN